MSNINITSLTMTADLNCALNLRDICYKINNVQFQEKPFYRLVIRLRNPKITCTVSANGKLVLLGAKSVDMARRGVRKIAQLVKKQGNKVRLNNIIVQNIAASFDFKARMPLENIESYLNKLKTSNACYTPELFPGLIIHYKNTSVTLQRSGKVSFTGSKSIEPLNKTYEWLTNELYNCKLI